MDNEIRLIGNLVKDPEIYSSNAGEHAKIRIACNTKYGKKESTLFIDVKLFGYSYKDLQYFNPVKGDKVSVVGRLEIEDYVDKNGMERRDAVVYSNQMHKIATKRNVESNF